MYIISIYYLYSLYKFIIYQEIYVCYFGNIINFSANKKLLYLILIKLKANINEILTK